MTQKITAIVLAFAAAAALACPKGTYPAPGAPWGRPLCCTDPNCGITRSPVVNVPLLQVLSAR